MCQKIFSTFVIEMNIFNQNFDFLELFGDLYNFKSK